MRESRRRMSHKISKSFTASELAALGNGNGNGNGNVSAGYDYFEETPKYVRRLVSHYCRNVVRVCIDWTNLSAPSFKFVKKLLCVDVSERNDFEGVRLRRITALFPALRELNVRHCALSSRGVADIFAFVSRERRRGLSANGLCRIEMSQMRDAKYSIEQCLAEWSDRFNDVGWTMTVNPFEHELCVLRIDEPTTTTTTQ